MLRARGSSAHTGLPAHSAARCSKLLSATPSPTAVSQSKAKQSSPPVPGPSPPLRKSPRKNAGSKPAEVYVPAKVYKPQPAHVVQQRGRKMEIAPAWTQRKIRHYPDEALDAALEQLKPAADKSKLRGNSAFAKPDCVAVCEAINKHYSVPDKGWFCNLQWFTLREHAEAAANGEEIAKPGEHLTIIPGTIIDMWAAWIGLDATDQRNPPLKQALQMLWELCEVAEISVPARTAHCRHRASSGRRTSTGRSLQPRSGSVRRRRRSQRPPSGAVLRRPSRRLLMRIRRRRRQWHRLLLRKTWRMC